jgi:hypothetical protein
MRKGDAKPTPVQTRWNRSLRVGADKYCLGEGWTQVDGRRVHRLKCFRMQDVAVTGGDGFCFGQSPYDRV